MLSSSLVSQRLRAWIVEFMQFGAVGASAFVIDAGLFNVFQYAPMPLGFLSGHPNSANVLAATIATIYSWIANRLWTYRGRTQENVVREGTLFVIANILGLFALHPPRTKYQHTARRQHCRLCGWFRSVYSLPVPILPLCGVHRHQSGRKIQVLTTLVP